MSPRHPGAVDMGGLLGSLLEMMLAPAMRVYHEKEMYEAVKKKYAKYDPSNWSKQLYELKRSGYITVTDGSIQFTNKGRMRAIEIKVERSPSVGKYRFISFDIPEQLRRERDSFRRTIKRVGFKQLQRSLWVCDKDIADYVERAAYEYGVEKYVVYIASESSDIDGVLNKMFSISEQK